MARTANVFAHVEPEVKEQAEQVLDDFEDTIKKLKNVASSLKVCDNPRLQSFGYRRINFQQHRYFMLYRIENDIASGRIAEVRSRSMSCNCMTRTSQQECRGILELISEYCFFNSLIVCISKR